MYTNNTEPIVEAKFYPHSYGFRALRSCKDAIVYTSHVYKDAGKDKPIYIIEGDIKGFFNNVNVWATQLCLKADGIACQRVAII